MGVAPHIPEELREQGRKDFNSGYSRNPYDRLEERIFWAMGFEEEKAARADVSVWLEQR